MRLTAVLTVAAGHTPEDMRSLLRGLDLAQLSQWLFVFPNDGLEALCTLAAFDEANSTPTIDLRKGWQAEGPISSRTSTTMKPPIVLTPEQRRQIERRRKDSTVTGVRLPTPYLPS